MASSHPWAFRASLRRNAFGWSGKRRAIERLNEAVGEIERMARTDPALSGEGAVPLLEKLSPAVSGIDSSSGALGNATAGVVEKMVPLVAAAPVPRQLREKWLERLFDAIQDDDPPYTNPWASIGASCVRIRHWRRNGRTNFCRSFSTSWPIAGKAPMRTPGPAHPEQVIHGNLTRLSRLLRILRLHAHDLNLAPSQTVYRRHGKGPKQALRFTKTSDSNLEAAYAQHFIWHGHACVPCARACRSCRLPRTPIHPWVTPP